MLSFESNVAEEGEVLLLACQTFQAAILFCMYVDTVLDFVKPRTS